MPLRRFCKTTTEPHLRAKLVGTTQSVISRLEDAGYSGHTLSMLDRIATVLHYRVVVRLVPEQEDFVVA